MKAASIVAACARRWTAAYTIALPAEVRDRRREEIASDLWEQQHHAAEEARDFPSAAHLAARVVRGMPADVLWRSAERRQTERAKLMDLAVDRTWDLRMRSIGRAALVAVIVFYIPIVIGLPVLLAITLPAGALAIRHLQRDIRKAGSVSDTVIAHQRKTRTVVVVAAIAIFAVGLFINALPSQDVHDRYWELFVAPLMIAFIVGVVALPMLVWSYLPRRQEPGA